MFVRESERRAARPEKNEFAISVRMNTQIKPYLEEVIESFPYSKSSWLRETIENAVIDQWHAIQTQKASKKSVTKAKRASKGTK